MSVNLARLASSCKWLRPKYCSTMYRFFEIFLFLSISYSVSFAVWVSFLIMPSSMLLRARKSRLGLLHPVKCLLRFVAIAIKIPVNHARMLIWTVVLTYLTGQVPFVGKYFLDGLFGVTAVDSAVWEVVGIVNGSRRQCCYAVLVPLQIQTYALRIYAIKW